MPSHMCKGVLPEDDTKGSLRWICLAFMCTGMSNIAINTDQRGLILLIQTHTVCTYMIIMDSIITLSLDAQPQTIAFRKYPK